MSEFNAQVDFQVYGNDHKKDGDNTPDERGRITVSKTLLKEMVELAKKDEDVVLAIAMWKRKSKNTGIEYRFGRLSVDEWAVKKNRGDSGNADVDFSSDDLFE